MLQANVVRCSSESNGKFRSRIFLCAKTNNYESMTHNALLIKWAKSMEKCHLREKPNFKT